MKATLEFSQHSKSVPPGDTENPSPSKDGGNLSCPERSVPIEPDGTVRLITEADIEEIVAWHRHWFPSTKIIEGWFAPLGFWVPGVCAGFLEIIEGTSRGIVSDFISNPLSLRVERDLALDALVVAIEAEARNRKLRYLCCSSVLPVIWNRALAHGYKMFRQDMKAFIKVMQ